MTINHLLTINSFFYVFSLSKSEPKVCLALDQRLVLVGYPCTRFAVR